MGVWGGGFQCNQQNLIFDSPGDLRKVKDTLTLGFDLTLYKAIIFY